LLTTSGDSGLELKTAHVGFQAGKYLGDFDDHSAFLRVGRVGEVVANQLAAHERHRPHQVGRLVRPRAEGAGKGPRGHGHEKNAERN
jgi:hypothetical protein